jgi:DNA polymerase III epsilon subunit-like protein
VYDRHVMAQEKVTDYRTNVSGVQPRHLKASQGAVSFAAAQRDVAALLHERMLVGHGLQNDLQALMLSHPRHLIRDTALYKKLCPLKPKRLKVLVAEHLGVDIQDGRHDSAEDARAALRLYQKYRQEWEKSVSKKSSGGSGGGGGGATPEAMARRRQRDVVERMRKKQANRVASHNQVIDGHERREKEAVADAKAAKAAVASDVEKRATKAAANKAKKQEKKTSRGTRRV